MFNVNLQVKAKVIFVGTTFKVKLTIVSLQVSSLKNKNKRRNNYHDVIRRWQEGRLAGQWSVLVEDYLSQLRERKKSKKNLRKKIYLTKPFLLT